MAKNSAKPIGMPSRMRLSAPTEGFIWFDSINEIVELVTPERLASSRCDSLWWVRTKRSRPPISTLMGIPVLQVFRIEQICLYLFSKINVLSGIRKGLVARSRAWDGCLFPSIEEARRDGPPDSQHPRPRSLLDAVHGEPAVQGNAAPHRLGGGHVLHQHRRPQGNRQLRRTLVRQRGPRPQA